MAKIGDMIQYQGPFNSGYAIPFITFPCVLGISVGEKDFMQAGSSTGDSSIQVKINNQSFFIGRTFIYQTQEQYDITSVQFPNGAPASTLVNIIYCPARSD